MLPVDYGTAERLALGTDEVTVLATSAQTDGALFAVEMRMPPGGGPPVMHRHAPGEVYYVLEGEFTFYAGEPGRPGTADHRRRRRRRPARRGTPHTVRNESDADAVAFVVHAPGAPMENFTRAVAALAADGHPRWTPSWRSPRNTASSCSAPSGNSPVPVRSADPRFNPNHRPRHPAQRAGVRPVRRRRRRRPPRTRPAPPPPALGHRQSRQPRGAPRPGDAGERSGPEVAGGAGHLKGMLQRHDGGPRSAELVLRMAEIRQMVRLRCAEPQLMSSLRRPPEMSDGIVEPVFGLRQPAQHGLGMDPAPGVADGFDQRQRRVARQLGVIGASERDLGPGGQDPAGALLPRRPRR